MRRRGKYYSRFFESVRGGSFEIGAKSHILRRVLIEKSYEQAVAEIAKKYLSPDKDAIDVGANIGFYTVLFAKNANSVLGVEPTTASIDLLKRNLARNNVEAKAIIFQGIAADRRDEYSLNVIEGLEEYSSIEPIKSDAVKGKKSQITKVTGDTVDNLVKAHNLKPSLVKIDTENSENDVVNGSLKTIKEFRPAIIFESKNPKDIIHLLSNNGYTVSKIGFEEFLALPVASA
jgi:FkbM family methyltransferase